MMSNALAITKPLPPSPLAHRYPKNLPQWVIELNTPVWDSAKNAIIYPEPSPEQRIAVRNSRDQFLQLLDQTPRTFPELGKEVIKELGALTLVKTRSTATTSLQAEATIHAFKKALWNLPAWAALRAINNWMIGKVEFYDEKDGTYNTKWMPDPGELRHIAERYAKDVHGRVQILDRILNEQSLLPKPVNHDDEGFKQIGSDLTISI